MNEPNRYAPPRSDLREPSSPGPAPGAVSGSARRPISVWLLLVFAECLALLAAVGAGARLLELGATGASPRAVANAAILVVLAGSLLALARAIHGRRPRTARALGTLLLAGIALAIAVSGSAETPCGASAACRGGWTLGRLAVAAVFASWAWWAGWSRAARRYYAGPSSRTEDSAAGPRDPRPL